MRDRRDIPSRVVVHVGFHRTGLQSAHAFVRHNRRTIYRHAQFVLGPQLKQAVKTARKFSANPDDFHRDRFRFWFIGLLGEIAPQHNRPLLISHPGLLGHMPGASGVKTYAAAPDLCEAMESGLRQVYGAEIPVTFIVTYRDPQAWLRSAWARLVEAGMTTLSQEIFADQSGPAADFDGAIKAVRAKAGSAEVRAIALEDLAKAPFGVGGVYIEPLRLPPRTFDKLEAVPIKGSSPDDAALLASLRQNREKV